MGEQLGMFGEPAPMGTGVRREAVLSPCRTYRYSLSRTWDDDLSPCLWVMLNPSTADAMVDDPTVRRCMAFSKAWGSGGIIVVNLFAFRAADPATLVRARNLGCDIRGPERDEHILSALGVCDVVVCAWGAHSLAVEGAPHVLSLVASHAEVSCLGRTQSGAPKHPLYLAATTRCESFPTRATSTIPSEKPGA